MKNIKFLFPILLTIIIVFLMLYCAIVTNDKALLYSSDNTTSERDLLDVVNHNHTIQ